jgi:hypothetical protein
MSLCLELSQEEDNSPLVESTSSFRSFITPEDEEITQEVRQSHHDHHQKEVRQQHEKSRLQEIQETQKTSLSCAGGVTITPASQTPKKTSLLSIQDSLALDERRVAEGIVASSSQGLTVSPSPRPASNTSSRSLDPNAISTADVDPDFLLDYRPETVDFPESPRLLSPSSLHITSRQQQQVSLTVKLKRKCIS